MIESIKNLHKKDLHPDVVGKSKIAGLNETPGFSPALKVWARSPSRRNNGLKPVVSINTNSAIQIELPQQKPCKGETKIDRSFKTGYNADKKTSRSEKFFAPTITK